MFQSEKNKFVIIQMVTKKGLVILTFHEFEYFISTQEKNSPPPNAIFFSNKDNSLLLP